MSGGAAAAARGRVFFALWPDERVRGALAALAGEAQIECGGRATKAAKVHLTLFFVGDIERERIGRLQSIAREIRGAPFELEIDQLGYWRHNRIVWAGATRCPRNLSLLAHALHAALTREGLPAEERPYVPHITLLRNARRQPKSKSVAPIAWRAEEFVLVESVQAGSAARYEVIARWPLVA